MSAPEVTCVVDVSVRHASSTGWVQVHSSQALRGGLVAAVTRAGPRAEAAVWPVETWASRLAQLADVPVPDAPPPPPDRDLRVPFDVLLGAGEALRTHRPDVLDELVRRAAATDPTLMRDQLVRLHTAVVGRLLAVVAAQGSGPAGAGWVSWLLFGDGWRALTPGRRDGRPLVVLSPRRPVDLGSQVAAQVALVRSTR